MHVYRSVGWFLFGAKKKSHLTISTSKRIKSRIVEAPDLGSEICSNTQLESWRVQCYKLFYCCYMAAARSQNKFPINAFAYTVRSYVCIDEHKWQEMQLPCTTMSMWILGNGSSVCVCVVNRMRHVLYSMLFILFYSQHLLLVLYKHARVQQKWLCH